MPKSKSKPELWSALKREHHLPLLAGNDQLSETEVQPTVGAQPFKPLFLVGSFVLPREPQSLKGQTQYRMPMQVERTLGCYSYILSDG